MRIAQVAPVFESVPPHGYGGTERVVHWLTEELVRRGHDVTLFASGDSQTSGRLVPMCARSLRRARSGEDAATIHTAALLQAIETVPEFDVIHAHVDGPAIALAHCSGAPLVTTLHGRLDLPEMRSVLEAATRAPLVSISHAQRNPVPAANWIATVHHGLPLDRVPFVPVAGEYVAFVGRISRDKRPDLAIRAACEAGVPLKIAAKVNGSPEDAEYFRSEIRPLLRRSKGRVEFVGEIGEAEKPALMGGARALLFPVDWPEPFGLVAIESMAFGTPVITRPRGALPEIVEDGRTGFVVETLEEMVAAIRASASLERAHARALVRSRFEVKRMVDDYEQVYDRVARRALATRGRDAL